METFLRLPFIVLFVGLSLSSFAQKADLILTNGKIFTSDTTQLYVEALAIKGNKILDLGSNAAIAKLASSQTIQIDLEGKTVVPGFNNAHDHPGWGARIGKSYSYTEMNPGGLSKTAVLDSIARLVKTAKPNQWIYGLIGTTVFFDTTMRNALDRIAPNNPVGLQVWWGHGMVVNGKALQTSGLSDQDKDPVGGWYIRNSANKISGLQQNAQAPIWIAFGNSEPANMVKGLQAFTQKQLSNGITSLQYMGTGFTSDIASQIFRQANLQQRVRIIAWPRSTPQGRQLSDWNGKNGQITPLTYISGIKYVIDGTPLEQNALRSVPYEGRPDWYGRLNYPVDTLKQIFREVLTSKRQLLMHITADSSFSVVLHTMKEMGKAEEWRKKRVRLEHNCVGDISGDISSWKRQAVKEMGILMMHTPIYCMASPLRSLLKSGIKVGISPDGSTNPFIEIMLMTSTHAKPEENLTREEAVIAYTLTNAYAEYMDEQKGTLTKGKVADLAVLSQDIFIIPANQLPATRSLLTMVDGKIVHQEGSLLSKRK